MPETIARFQKRFSGCGFQATAMTPVYGMAECSVGLTFPPLGRGPLIDTIERDAFMCSGAAIPASEKITSALRFVSCGLPLNGHQVRVVDEFTARSATRGYFRNPIASARRPGWMQVLRLSVGALRPAARRAGRYAIELLYASWFWTLFSLSSVLTFLLVLPPLRPASIWSIAHHAARTFVRGAGIKLSVRGQEHLRPARTHIVVANHSSYLDPLFVLAALPYSCRFVAKSELEHRPFVGALLRRLRTEFVERFDVRASAVGAEHLTEIVRAGHSCIFFPEGTFTRAPGLMPFHLGAFAAAVEAGVPVLPVAIRGTRSMLRDEQWLPRRGRVIVTIDKPIMPPRLPNAFTAAVQLRDAARGSISRHCGEPDMLATRGTEANHV